MTLIQRVELLADEVEKLGEGGGGDLSAYLTKDEASSTYETQTGAATTYETQAHASSTYLAKNADPLVIATYTNPTEDTNDGTANIYLGSLTNSTTDSHNNTVIGYNVNFKPKTWYSVAIGHNCAIEYAKGNSNGGSSVAINGKVYGKNSVAIQGTAGVDTDTYGENRIAILGEAYNRGSYLTSLNSHISGNTSKNWCAAINTGKAIGGGNRFISDCQDSIYMGQLRASITDCSGCVGIGSKYFNKNDQTYNNVISIGNDLLPSTSNCVILGSYSNDMRTSGSFFVVGNGTDDSNRSNLVEITTPLKITTAGIEVNGTPYGQTATSSETLPSAGTGTTFDTGIEWTYIQTKNDFILDSEGSQIKFRYGFTKGSYIHYFGYILDSQSDVRIVHLELGAPTGSGTTALATWISSGAIPTT